jgi:hypothetical protein
MSDLPRFHCLLLPDHLRTASGALDANYGPSTLGCASLCCSSWGGQSHRDVRLEIPKIWRRIQSHHERHAGGYHAPMLLVTFPVPMAATRRLVAQAQTISALISLQLTAFVELVLDCYLWTVPACGSEKDYGSWIGPVGKHPWPWHFHHQEIWMTMLMPKRQHSHWRQVQRGVPVCVVRLFLFGNRQDTPLEVASQPACCATRG